MTKYWHHPAAAVADVILAMQQGNAGLHPEARKDLSIGQHPHYSWHQYPQALHHWTRQEVEQFLAEKLYPRSSYRDHELARRAALAQALLAGDFVPADVLAEPEGQAVLNDTVLKLQVDIEMRQKSAAHEKDQLEFQRLLSSPDGAAAAKLGRLLVEAMYYGEAALVSRLGDRPVPGLRLRTEATGHFSRLTLYVLDGAESSRFDGRCLQIRDGRLPDVSLFGVLCELDLQVLEDHLRTLMQKSHVTLAQCRRLMGEHWSPAVKVDSYSSVA